MGAAYKAIIWVLWFFAFASWVVAIAGISAITADCYNNYLGNGQYTSRTYTSAINNGFTATPPNWGQNCVRGLNFQWWGVWFEFIVLALILGFSFTSKLPAHQATLTGLLATVTAINMINSRIFLDTSFTNYIYEVSNRQSALNVAAAGYIMFCTFNMIYILLLGSGLLWFKEGDYVVGYGDRNAAAAATKAPPPNFAQPATFASPLSGGGARSYLPTATGRTGEVTISGV